MNLTDRDRRAITLGGIGLGALLVIFLVVLFVDSWTAARQEVSNHHEQLERTNRKLQRFLSQRSRLTKRFGVNITKPLSDISAAKVNLFDAAQEVFKASGIKITVYRPQRSRPIRDIPGVEIVTLRANGKCQLSQLVKCLQKFSTAKHLVFVDSLQITHNDKNTGPFKVTMVLATLGKNGAKKP